MAEDFNHVPRIHKELERLNKMHIEVGIFTDNSFIRMIAVVNEYGLTIKPHGQWLTIPTENAGKYTARQIPGLFKPKGKNILAVSDPASEGGLKVMFILLKQVVIPERSFVRSTYDENLSKWTELCFKKVTDIVTGDGTADEVGQALGKRMQKDIRTKIKQMKTPHNSPLTVARKGHDNPLIDTGKLVEAVRYKVSFNL